MAALLGSWGTELWDSYANVFSHVNKGADELLSVYAKESFQGSSQFHFIVSLKALNELFNS